MKKNRKSVWIAGIVLMIVFFAAVCKETEESHESETEVTITEAEDGHVESSSDAVSLSELEVTYLSELYSAMKAGNFVHAAKILNENEALFKSMTEGTFRKEKYYYREEEREGIKVPIVEKLPENGNAEGLVLLRYHTAFYGSFADGQPDGRVSAVQSMILDEPRYTYADGEWKNGKMNGEGMTGYHYYINAPESGFIRTEKSGNYKDDLLEGNFVYRTENGAGEIFSWNICAKDGVTVVDDTWTYYASRNEYMLASAESKERAYVLSEERQNDVMWNNLITWEKERK